MYIATAADPVSAIRAEARYAAAHSLPVRIWHRLAAWQQQRAERQQAALVAKLEHPGLMADFQSASRG
jgi:hypothetical protein